MALSFSKHMSPGTYVYVTIYVAGWVNIWQPKATENEREAQVQAQASNASMQRRSIPPLSQSLAFSGRRGISPSPSTRTKCPRERAYCSNRLWHAAGALSDPFLSDARESLLFLQRTHFLVLRRSLDKSTGEGSATSERRCTRKVGCMIFTLRLNSELDPRGTRIPSLLFHPSCHFSFLVHGSSAVEAAATREDAFKLASPSIPPFLSSFLFLRQKGFSAASPQEERPNAKTVLSD